MRQQHQAKKPPDVVKPEEIELFSRCPRRLHYHRTLSRGIKVPAGEGFYSAIKDAILRAYRSRMKVGHTTWPTFTSWIDKRIYGDCTNLSDPDLFAESKRRSITARGKVNKWFHGVYLPDKREIWTDLVLRVGAGLGREIEATVDVLALHPTDGLSLIQVGPELTDPSLLRRDMQLRTKLWAVGRHLDELPRYIEYLGIGPSRREIQREVVRFRRGEIRSVVAATEKAILHIAHGIWDGVSYPSVNEQCKGCEFKSICSF